VDEDDAAVEFPMREEASGDAGPHGFLGHAQKPRGAGYVEEVPKNSTELGRMCADATRDLIDGEIAASDLDPEPGGLRAVQFHAGESAVTQRMEQ
jgi:hypothetical protein